MCACTLLQRPGVQAKTCLQKLAISRGLASFKRLLFMGSIRLERIVLSVARLAARTAGD
jgi:hypothetical protein